ncbi:hypothetical protein PPYR_02752 [Photinus pyralis]|uniref:C2H2-type domain-containing protein n=1 Tax=Photinus pyralis TaxID=7054 RepID=A0A5N4A0V8_PHOPY|nr:zinc finger matrin-type protein 3-like [Photinus pyralis]KAB0790952.1 hypothetical protein PPYR_02752 [Photinus pyralis]
MDSSGNLKRGPQFSTNFIIPRKQAKTEDTNSPSNALFQPLQNVYAEDPTTVIYKTISQIQEHVERTKEKPKTSASTQKYRDTFPHLSDPTLPAELQALFQPLFCKLCECQHSSNIMAKLHYDSKRHMKKVRAYLIEYAETTGTPLHEKAKPPEKQFEDHDPKYFYCQPCDLPLTGRLHAESHYSSRNHRRVILGAAPPAGRGQYDGFGNWIRTSTVVPKPHDSFGVDFVIPEEIKIERHLRQDGLRCYVCNVCVTSEQQLEIHKNGSKHKKKMKLLEVPQSPVEAPHPHHDNTILSTLSCPSISKKDLSVFRTPSGFYYCNPCNLTLNSEVQFKQHLDSKKHKKKANVT